MMAWGVPGLFFSPGYYQMLGELREMFEMLTAGLEGHAGRLKDCRETWETADMNIAKDFSQYHPEGLGGSIQWGGSTFTDGDGNFQMFETAESKKQSYAKPIFGAMDTVEKIQKVGRAENAGELIGAVADVSNSCSGPSTTSPRRSPTRSCSSSPRAWTSSSPSSSPSTTWSAWSPATASA
nr:hypothetical protein GCM10025732_05200 [Glycomyces mayteni]